MTNKPPLDADMRADLYRVACAFSDSASSKYAGVRVEPIRGGGVVMVGYNGMDLIAVEDPTGSINRPATIAVSKAILNIAVDLFRREGVHVRLKANNDMAWIDPDQSGQAAREIERGTHYDWRQILAPHALMRLDPPFVHDGRMARKLSDAAIGLARAAQRSDEPYVLKGGMGATLATFPTWPDAVALFTHRAELDAVRAEEGLSTLWHPSRWVTGPRLAAVPGGA